ncbi:MAG: hypothetical protein ABWZ15_05020 [Acidimicrobiia bacterium]
MPCSVPGEGAAGTLDAVIEGVVRLRDVAAAVGRKDVLFSAVETMLAIARARRVASSP